MFLYQVCLNTDPRTDVQEYMSSGSPSLLKLMPDSSQAVRRCWGVPDEDPVLFCSLRSRSIAQTVFLSSLPFGLFLEQNSLCDAFPLLHLLTERIRFHLSRHLPLFPSLPLSLSLSLPPSPFLSPSFSLSLSLHPSLLSLSLSLPLSLHPSPSPPLSPSPSLPLSPSPPLSPPSPLSPLLPPLPPPLSLSLSLSLLSLPPLSLNFVYIRIHMATAISPCSPRPSPTEAKQGWAGQYLDGRLLGKLGCFWKRC